MVRKGTKKIAGKTFGLKTDYYTKSLANKHAEQLRRKGYLVRILPRKARGTEKRYSNIVYEIWMSQTKVRKKKLPDWRKKKRRKKKK